MFFHVSIDANDPKNVAHVIAELWGGKAFPFPGVIGGSWVALSGDQKGSSIEVYPRGTVLREGKDGISFGEIVDKDNGTATHIAMASVLSIDEIFAVAKREGWKAEIGRPGDAFDFVHIWAEGHQSLEVFAPEQQQEYLDAFTIPAYERSIEGWLAMDVIGKAKERE